MKAAVPFLFAAVLLGCAVETLESRPRRISRVEGVGVIDPGGGHLRYAITGGNFMIGKRRKRAFKKMTKHCGGEKRLKIKKEYTIEDVETSFQQTDLEASKLLEQDHYTVERYRHVIFECAGEK